MAETRARSAAKGVTWRFLATCTTMILVYVFTGELMLSLSVGALEVIIKFVIYYLHERVWDKIPWGEVNE